jgi:hypothetical protein
MVEIPSISGEVTGMVDPIALPYVGIVSSATMPGRVWSILPLCHWWWDSKSCAIWWSSLERWVVSTWLRRQGVGLDGHGRCFLSIRRGNGQFPFTEIVSQLPLWHPTPYHLLAKMNLFDQSIRRTTNRMLLLLVYTLLMCPASSQWFPQEKIRHQTLDVASRIVFLMCL